MDKKAFKKSLHQILKNDYTCDIFDFGEEKFVLIFYHLNSAYSAICSCSKVFGKWNEPIIDWQYTSKNKKIEKLAKQVVSFAVEYYEKYKNYNYIENEIKFYNDLSRKIFEAKYSFEIENYTNQ